MCATRVLDTAPHSVVAAFVTDRATSSNASSYSLQLFKHRLHTNIEMITQLAKLLSLRPKRLHDLHDNKHKFCFTFFFLPNYTP